MEPNAAVVDFPTDTILGCTYKYSRNGTTFVATVVKDKGDKVYLQCKDRVDSFRISRAELDKFYKRVQLS